MYRRDPLIMQMVSQTYVEGDPFALLTTLTESVLSVGNESIGTGGLVVLIRLE